MARFNRRGGTNKRRGGGKKTRKLIDGGGRLLGPLEYERDVHYVRELRKIEKKSLRLKLCELA